MHKCASQIESDTVSYINELPIDCNAEIIDFLVTNFPIMVVSKCSEKVLINIKDFILDKHAFTLLVCDENKEKSTSSQNSNTQISTVDLVETQQPKKIGPMKQRGRVPLWQQFPTLIEDFIKRHSFSVQCRRRESTGTGTGVSLKQIREYVMNEVPGLRDKGISRDTIHFLLAPPRKNTIRAERYKSLIDARVPAKSETSRRICYIISGRMRILFL